MTLQGLAFIVVFALAMGAIFLIIAVALLAIADHRWKK
jgi:hypothetical protein